MKILFVTSTYPEDIQMSTNGIHQRMKMFMEALNTFADLDVLFYVSPDVDISPERAVRMEKLLHEHWRCKTRVFLCRRSKKTTVSIPNNFPFSDRLKEWWFIPPSCYWAANHEHMLAFEKCLERKPDAVFVHRISSIYPVLSSRKVVQPVYFDLDDIEHKSFVRGLRQPPFWRSKFLQYLKVPYLVWLERRAIKQAQKTFVCSENDRDYLMKTLHLPGVVTIPNAIDIPKLLEIPNKPTLLFLGPMSYQPNAVAADYLIRSIWPSILSALPDAKLIIAGAKPEHIASFADSPPGVEFRGFVDDLEKLYKDVMVVCCPILTGGGTRIKILEAAAYGKPVVSTTIGAEGIALKDGEEILLRDDQKSFAEACIRLLQDRNLAASVGGKARSVVARQYDKQNVINLIKLCLS